MDGDTSQAPEHQIPELVSFEPKTRDVVIGSIKLVLRRLRKMGVLTHEGEYADLLKNPAALHEFIERFKENRDVASDLAVDAKGHPVDNDRTTLVCNLTLAQIERLLVYTCAKKRLASVLAEKGGEAGKRTSADLPEVMKDVIGFSWQLPLFETYFGTMNEEQFRVLGPRVLALQTAEALAPIAGMESHNIRKAEKLMEAQFDAALRLLPAAIRGAATCNPKNYKMLRKAAGKNFLTVLSAEPQIVLEISGMSHDRVAALAPFAAKLCTEVLQQIDAVPDAMMPPMMNSFGQVFGDLANDLLGEPEFAKKFLFGIVGSMRDMKVVNDDELAAATQATKYKWEAVKHDVLAWWDKRPR